MYFLDTYALIEYVKGNGKFVDFINGNHFCVSDFQLMELYYFTLRENGEDLAEKHFETFAKFKVEVPERTLKNAMKKRLEFHKASKKISYVDAIGCQYAIDNNMKFVTGDIEFKNEKTEHVFYMGK